MKPSLNNYSINRSRYLIVGSSNATRGSDFNDVSREQQMERRIAVLENLKKKSLYEKIWYTLFILAELLCLILIRPFTYSLAFGALSGLLYLFSENLQANGKRVGFIIALTSATLYVVDCIVFKIYGEVAMNLLVYMPIYAYSFFSYKRAEKKDGNKKFLSVRKLGVWGHILVISLIVALGVGVGYILKLVGSIYPFINAFSLTCFIAAMMLNAFRYVQTWYFDMLGNLFTLLLWIFVSSGELSSLPFVISTFAAFTNDIYGMFSWGRLLRKSKPSGGKILNMRPLKINKVIKIRRQYKELVWNKDIDSKSK